MKKRTKFVLAGVLAFGLGFVFSLKSAPAQDVVRFDQQVRTDFFAGFSGNAELLGRGMAACEKILARDPDHAEALVWHGAGIYYRSGQAMRSKDTAKGMELFQKGLAEMDRAVELAPDNIGVRIPRGAVLLTSAALIPKPFGNEFVERGISDYQRAYDLQKDQLMQMGSHPRGELLSGLAFGFVYLEKNDKAEAVFKQIKETNPNSDYSKRADKWLETKSLQARETGCIGCHAPGK